MTKGNITVNPIGLIHTPYESLAPFRPDENQDGEFIIEINPDLEDALFLLSKFDYIHVLFYIDRSRKYKTKVYPPNADGKEVGLFASRSPNRPNPIGLSIVKIIKIEKNLIYTTGIDILNNTPLLDIKPYIPDLDCKPNAGSGWLNN